VLPILLAAASALVWGTADYAGGRASRRVAALRVAVLSKVFSLPVLALYLALTPAPLVPATLAWGAVAGTAGMLALITFYRALSAGAMAVVAPVSAVTTAVLPFAFGLLTGDRPGAAALVGVGCAVGAIALVSMVPGSAAPEDGGAAGGGAVGGAGRPVGTADVAAAGLRRPRRATAALVGQAMAAGVGFGLFFVLLDRGDLAAGGDAGLWPVVAAQAGAITVGGLLLARAARAGAGWTVPLRGTLLGWLVAAGVLDMTANVLYLIAVRDGLLSVVAPVSALYPVSTVLLALALDRERVRAVQVAGLGLAVAALVLVVS
jgi:drug/metabolite transporter (DMT)-like permease